MQLIIITVLSASGTTVAVHRVSRVLYIQSRTI